MIPYVHPFGWSVHTFQGKTCQKWSCRSRRIQIMKDQVCDAKGFGLNPEDYQEPMNHLKQRSNLISSQSSQIPPVAPWRVNCRGISWEARRLMRNWSSNPGMTQWVSPSREGPREWRKGKSQEILCQWVWPDSITNWMKGKRENKKLLPGYQLVNLDIFFQERK